MSGNIRPQSYQLAEPLWTDPGSKSGISERELISTLKKERKKKKKRRRGINRQTFSQNPCKRGKSHHQRLTHSGLRLMHVCHRGIQSMRIVVVVVVTQ